jgi:nucleotide-binding universal stress UspA family protein
LQARAAGSAIVDEALGRGARLIVMGTQVRRRSGEMTAGRTTIPYVLKNAPCEVVICRRALKDD